MEIVYLNPESVMDGSIVSSKLNESTFKTINGETLLGEGDIEVSGGVDIVDSVGALDENAKQGSLAAVVVNKEIVETYSIKDSYYEREDLKVITELNIHEPSTEIFELSEGDAANMLFLTPNGLDPMGAITEGKGIMMLGSKTVDEGTIVNLLKCFTFDGNEVVLYENAINEEGILQINSIIQEWGGAVCGMAEADENSEGIHFVEPYGMTLNNIDAFMGYEKTVQISIPELYTKLQTGWGKNGPYLVNNLNDDSVDGALSAKMGKILNSKIDEKGVHIYNSIEELPKSAKVGTVASVLCKKYTDVKISEDFEPNKKIVSLKFNIPEKLDDSLLSLTKRTTILGTNVSSLREGDSNVSSWIGVGYDSYFAHGYEGDFVSLYHNTEPYMTEIAKYSVPGGELISYDENVVDRYNERMISYGDTVNLEHVDSFMQAVRKCEITKFYIKNEIGWEEFNEGPNIVGSVKSLDAYAPQGSLGVVVKNYVETYSIRDSFVKNENPVTLKELRLSEPNIEIEGNIEETPFVFGPKGASIEDMANGVSPGIGIFVIKNEDTPLFLGAAGPDQIFEDYGDSGVIILYSNGVFDEEKLTIVNEYIKDKNFVLFGAENMNYDDSQPIENMFIDPTDEQFDLLDAFLGYEIVDKSTTLYIKESEGWKEFNLDVVNDFNGGIDKALSAEMGKVLNEKISGFIAGNTTEPIKFKGYVNVETTKDIDKIYDNMQIGEACLVAPSVKGDADSDSYVPWIYTATQKDYLPLGDGLLKADISKVLNGEIRTYFTLDKENPTWRCPDMLLLAKVKVKIKQFIGIIDISDTLRNILNLLPDSTEITACIGKILRWSMGDAMPEFAEEVLKLFDKSAETIGHKTKYPYGTKLANMLTNGVCAYTPDTIVCPFEGVITANWTAFVTCSTDPDVGGYYHFTQTAICRDSPRTGNMWVRMGYYKGSAAYPEDLQFFDWSPVGISNGLLNILLEEISNAVYEVLGDVTTKEITYSELVWKRDTYQLIPGTTYRITDYQCTTTEENTKAADHQFDIIVTADSTNTLSHLAKAILHEGDTYFENCNLEAWQLWYDIDNDTSKYAWADEVNGKGVIYRMIDEHNNDCPYDFKNIMFYTDKYTDKNVTEDKYYYTFSYMVDSVLYEGSVNDNVSYCYGTEIKPYYSSNEQKLNHIVFKNTKFTDHCNSNIFGYNCCRNIFYYGCYCNTFGDNCQDNTSTGSGFVSNTLGNNFKGNSFKKNTNSNIFGNNCQSNTFGDDFLNNTFGNNCQSNNFGKKSTNNIFGNSCNDNTFDYNFENNVLGNNCTAIVIGSDCCYNCLGCNCSSINIGNYCTHNKFGNYCISIGMGDYCDNNLFGDYCQFVKFRDSFESAVGGNYYRNIEVAGYCSCTCIKPTSTILDGNYLQNIKVTSGVSGTTDAILELTIEPNRDFETKVAKNSSGEIKIYCEADLVE